MPTYLTVSSQPFWGDMVAASGAGPKPIPQKQLTIQNLSDAIEFCLTPAAATAAAGLAALMKTENGVATAVRSFHANLPLENLRCDILRDQPAVWTCKRGKRTIRLSKKAAGVLFEHLKVDQKKLAVNETKTIRIVHRRWDPLTGTASALTGTTIDMARATADIVILPVQTYQRRALDKKAILSTDTVSEPGTPPPTPGISVHPSKATRARGCMNTAGALAGASAAGVGGFFRSYGRGFYVDIPLAITEGFRNVPQLYGERVPEHEPVHDWQSGARVAGKNFVTGMSEGLTDLFVQPYKAREEGAMGITKGVGKGVLGLVSKTASGKPSFIRAHQRVHG